MLCPAGQSQLVQVSLCGSRRQCATPAHQENSETRVHYGYRRVHVMLRREGWRDNHKRICRLYSEQGLSLRLKRARRNKPAQRRQPRPQGLYRNHIRGMDFVSDALFDGRRLRPLTVIDLYTRECLGICLVQNLRTTEVAEMLDSIAFRRPLPQLLKTDNGLPSESTILHAGIQPSNTKTIVHFNIRYCPHFLSAYKYAYHDIQGSEMARQDLTQHFWEPWTLSII